MGVVSIPPNPTGGGRLSVRLELDPPEVQVTLDLLKAALHRLQSRSQSDSSLSAVASSSGSLESSQSNYALSNVLGPAAAAQQARAWAAASASSSLPPQQQQAVEAAQQAVQHPAAPGRYVAPHARAREEARAAAEAAEAAARAREAEKAAALAAQQAAAQQAYEQAQAAYEAQQRAKKDAYEAEQRARQAREAEQARLVSKAYEAEQARLQQEQQAKAAAEYAAQQAAFQAQQQAQQQAAYQAQLQAQQQAQARALAAQQAQQQAAQRQQQQAQQQAPYQPQQQYTPSPSGYPQAQQQQQPYQQQQQPQYRPPAATPTPMPTPTPSRATPAPAPVPARAPVTPPASAPAPAAPTPAPKPRPQQWRCVCQSDPMDHNKEAVYALSYSPQIDGLPGGDGHGGWLISSSRRMLNLWECNMGGGGGMPSIMLMHSQETDFMATSLSIEASLHVMYGAGADTRAGNAVNGQAPDALTVHSLSADRGMLAYQYKFVLPKPAAPAVAPQGQPKRGPPPRTVSLHPMGRNLRGCVAVSVGPRMMVFESNVGGRGGDVQAPRFSWSSPNETAVTSLHASAASGLLLSGGVDGTVAVWNARDKLGQQPAVRTISSQATSPITAIQLLSEYCLATGAASGNALLWDLRSAKSPLQTLPLPPDCGAVLSMRTSPAGDCVAVAAARGLFAISLSPGSPAPIPGPCSLVAGATPGPGRSFQDLEWNWATGELYACGHSGMVSAYKRVV